MRDVLSIPTVVSENDDLQQEKEIKKKHVGLSTF